MPSDAFDPLGENEEELSGEVDGPTQDEMKDDDGEITIDEHEAYKWHLYIHIWIYKHVRSATKSVLSWIFARTSRPRNRQSINQFLAFLGNAQDQK